MVVKCRRENFTILIEIDPFLQFFWMEWGKCYKYLLASVLIEYQFNIVILLSFLQFFTIYAKDARSANPLLISLAASSAPR